MIIESLRKKKKMSHHKNSTMNLTKKIQKKNNYTFLNIIICLITKTFKIFNLSKIKVLINSKLSTFRLEKALTNKVRKKYTCIETFTRLANLNQSFMAKEQAVYCVWVWILSKKLGSQGLISSIIRLYLQRCGHCYSC